jgi:DNA helicase II / ATP-dependent DNA helicase PcrA
MTAMAPVKHFQERLSNWGGFGRPKPQQPQQSQQPVRKPASPGPNFTRASKLPTASPQMDAFVGDDASQIMVGMEVEHQKFGSGKVLHMEGDPGDRKATVFFPGHGHKQLLLRYAKLRIIG